MLVESIKLENFRNYGSLELEFDPGTNLFYGDNAQGKTNILEAVYLVRYDPLPQRKQGSGDDSFRSG